MRVGTMMSAAAVLILLTAAMLGAYYYPRLPDPIPTHWNAAGQADAFTPKSVWSVFGVLFVGFGVVGGMLLLQRVTARVSAATPAEAKTFSLVFGYMNLWMAVLFSWIAYAAWNSTNLGPLFIVLVSIGVLPVLVILGLNIPEMIKQRKALTAADEPSLDPKYWVWGGMFYSNERDPRMWVPKPPHMGIGMTINLASSGGRLVMAGILVLICATLVLPFVIR